jgi:hypothetical protein
MGLDASRRSSKALAQGAMKGSRDLYKAPVFAYSVDLFIAQVLAIRVDPAQQEIVCARNR